MNQLAQPEVHHTMSSREIAELTGKQHCHVVRDVEHMLTKLEIGQSKFGSTYLDGQGKERKCYNLDHDLTMTLVSGYSIPLRHRIVTRWSELEKAQSQPAPLALPQTYREALQALLQQVEVNEQQANQLEEQKPKVKYHDEVLSSDGLLTAEQVAKTLGIRSAIALNKRLHTLGVQFKRKGAKHFSLYAAYAEKGYAKVVPSGTYWDRWEGCYKTARVLKWTEEGLQFLHDFLANADAGPA